MVTGKILLGVVGCPTCKEQSMEVRPDRSGAAFGYCVLCSQQLRVGGARDRMFRENWGLPATNENGEAVTVTDTVGQGGGGPAVESETPPAATVTETAEEAAPPPSKKKRATCLLDA